MQKYEDMQKQTLDLNARAKTTKLLEENTGVNIHDLKLGNGFSDMAPKAQTTKEKLNGINLSSVPPPSPAPPPRRQVGRSQEAA